MGGVPSGRLNIPARTGLEVLKWLRAQPKLRHIVVILWTATLNGRIVSQAYQNGVNSFLLKPARAADLARLARLLKSYWLEANCVPPECGAAG